MYRRASPPKVLSCCVPKSSANKVVSIYSDCFAEQQNSKNCFSEPCFNKPTIPSDSSFSSRKLFTTNQNHKVNGLWMQINELTTWVPIYIIQFSVLFPYFHLNVYLKYSWGQAFQGMKKWILQTEASIRWFR